VLSSIYYHDRCTGGGGCGSGDGNNLLTVIEIRCTIYATGHHQMGTVKNHTALSIIEI